MSPAFEEIAHLASSENRVRVLEALAEGSATRRELQDDLAVSQSTASRILADFEDRGWIRHVGGTYETTPLGTIVARAFARLVGTMEAKAELGEVLEWLPIDGDGLDVTDFSSATVVAPTRTDLFRHVRFIADRMEAAAEVRGFASAISHESLETNWRAVTVGGQSFELVVTPEIVDVIVADPEMAGQLADLLAAERAAFHVYDGEIPYTVGLIDGRVGFGLVDGDGNPRAYVETDDERVRAWFEARYEAYREGARRLAPDDLDDL